jgi:hypothetical protein
MTNRVACTFVLFVAAGAAFSLSSRPVAACDADGLRCVQSIEPAPAPAPPAVETAPPAAPMKLGKHMRKPVASVSARTIKTGDGTLVTVKLARRTKSKPAGPQFMPVVVSPVAAQAFAEQAASQVRVVSANEANEIDLAADAAPEASSVIAVTSESSVQIAAAGPVNEADAATETRAVSLDRLNKSFAAVSEAKPETPDENKSWFQRMLLVLGGAFAAVAATARMLIGQA